MKKQIVYLGIVCLVLFFASDVFASRSAGGGLPYEDGLGKLQASITGPFAFVVSILGIVAAGAMLVFGQEIGNFIKTSLYLVLVVSVIISATNFLQVITGTGALVL